MEIKFSNKTSISEHNPADSLDSKIELVDTKMLSAMELKAYNKIRNSYISAMKEQAQLQQVIFKNPSGNEKLYSRIDRLDLIKVKLITSAHEHSWTILANGTIVHESNEQRGNRYDKLIEAESKKGYSLETLTSLCLSILGVDPKHQGAINKLIELHKEDPKNFNANIANIIEGYGSYRFPTEQKRAAFAEWAKEFAKTKLFDSKLADACN